MTDAEWRREAESLLDEATTRGHIKRLAERLDHDRQLRAAVVTEGRRRGAQLPDEAMDWPAKRLLRVARAREAPSRVRGNPVARDEAFECMHCGMQVPAHGRTARDHCPSCLHSAHVDVVPGDRQAGCGGLLVPMSMELRAGHPQLTYRCARCGMGRVNRALLDGEPPDDWSAIVGLSAAGQP